jgi:hypothetical protein
VRFAALQAPVGTELDHDRRDFEQCVRRGVESAGLDVDDDGQECAKTPRHQRWAGVRATRR